LADVLKESGKEIVMLSSALATERMHEDTTDWFHQRDLAVLFYGIYL
jgi:hypothetical protein